MPSFLLPLPLALQGILIVTDEFFFHRKRGLPAWEKYGHPVDMLFTMIPYLVAILFPFGAVSSAWFIAFSVLSSVIITKDEWVHTRLANAPEHWLHSLLFIVHPVSFFSVWAMWKPESPLGAFGRTVMLTQVLLMLAFACYHFVWWFFVKGAKKEK